MHKSKNILVIPTRAPSYLIFILFFIAAFLGGCHKEYVAPNSTSGFYYVVKKADTLYSVAKEHGIETDELAKLNNIDSKESIAAGMILFIPGRAEEKLKSPDNEKDGQASNRSRVEGKEGESKTSNKSKQRGKPVKAAKSSVSEDKGKVLPDEAAKLITAKKERKKDPDQNDVSLNRQTEKEKSVIKGTAGAASAGPGAHPKDTTFAKKREGALKETFTWPLKGKVISSYGPQANGMFYNGIRIETRKEAIVSASAGGQVIFSALLKDYGETIIIRHENNYATVYTHLGKRLVRVDQHVKGGDRIALVNPSSTGEAFFDFEIRHNNKAIDPLLFLS